MDTTNSPVFYRPGNEESFFRKKHNTTIAFAVAVLLFLLPFAELRCTGYTLARNSGLGIAIGSEWKSQTMKDMKDLMESMPDKGEGKKDIKKGMKESPNIFAILALVAGISGLLFALSRSGSRHVAQMSAGILAVLMLIALLIQLKLQLRAQMSGGKKGDDFGSSGAFGSIITLRFTIWYYISLIGFAAAAFFAFKHHRIALDDALRNAHHFDFQSGEQSQPETNSEV